MEFIKRHYEKIILSVVLLGLGAAAAWLPIAIKEAKEELASQFGQAPSPKPLQALDLSEQKKALERLQNPSVISLTAGHNLLNPVRWKRSGTNLTKILVEGPQALVVKNIKPLYTKISFDRVAGTGYFFSIEQHSVKKPTKYIKPNEKPKADDLFVLREVEGPAEDPAKFWIELTDSQEKVPVTKAEPFQRVDGYAVDLLYPPDTLNLSNKHLNDRITFGGDDYKIVYITNNAVRVSAESTIKQTTITWSGTPQ